VAKAYTKISEATNMKVLLGMAHVNMKVLLGLAHVISCSPVTGL